MARERNESSVSGVIPYARSHGFEGLVEIADSIIKRVVPQVRHVQWMPGGDEVDRPFVTAEIHTRAGGKEVAEADSRLFKAWGRAVAHEDVDAVRFVYSFDDE